VSGLSHANLVILVGALTHDPELHEFSKDKCVCKLRLATNEYTGFGKNRKQIAEYHDIRVWGVGGKAAARVLKRGWTIMVQGKIRTRKWTTPEGKKRRNTEINCGSVSFLARPKKDQEEAVMAELERKVAGPPPEVSDEEIGIPPDEADFDEDDDLGDWPHSF
jgi:single-strand DNA-binding protein